MFFVIKCCILDYSVFDNLKFLKKVFGDRMNNLVMITILFLVILWIFIYIFDFKSLSFKEFKFSKGNILVLVIFCISAFSILTVTAKQDNEVLDDNKLKELKNQYFAYEDDNKLTNKVIVVGDSRMSLIEDNKDLMKPFNFIFVAKSGMMIDWLKDDALKEIKYILRNKDYHYNIVLNMGVNDLNNEDYNGDEIAKDYFKIYRDLAKEYPDVSVYLLSVNPIDDVLINQKWNNHRTTKKIKLFNNTIQKEMKKSHRNNMFYCDSYNSIHFETYDGLHYTDDTNKRIMNYIINDCVQY